MAKEGFFRKDFTLLANIHQESESDRNLELDMGITLHEIHGEIKATEELDFAWTHHLLSTTCANISGDEMVRRTKRFLEKAATSMDKILRLTQRYLLFDSIFLSLTKGGQLPARRRERWEQQKHEHTFKATDVLTIADKKIAKLENIIDEIKYEIAQAEKLQKEEKKASQKKKVPTRSVDVQARGKSSTASTQTKTIETRSLGIQTHLQNTQDGTVQWHTDSGQSPRQKRSHKEDSEEVSAKVKVVSDEEYLIQLIHESADREEEQKQDREKEIPKTCQKTKMDVLKQDLRELEESLQKLPKRRFAEAPSNLGASVTCAFCGGQGIHFSDSCPEMVHGDERHRWIKRRGRCVLCLGACSRWCEDDYKECWYCSVVRTRAPILKFLIPKDDGHHRALCTIPDSKDRIRRAIEEVKQEIEKAERN